MTNTVVQSPLVSIEHQASRQKLVADIDANLTDMFTRIGASGRLALASLADPLLIMDRQRFFAEVVTKVNENYDLLNTAQPGLALAHVSVPLSIDDAVAFKAFAAGIDTQAAAVGAVPINSVAPSVTGTKTVGQTITAVNGTWSGSPSFTYQWQRDGVNISGATASTYVLQVADGTHTVRVKVTGTNASGATSAVSAGDVIAAS